MTKPVTVDLPHKLGAVEAKRRIAGGIGRLKDQIPGGGEVRSGWTGDRLDLAVTAMNQQVTAKIDVQETIVRLEVTLPGVLSFFGNQVEALIRRRGGALLEDKRK